jgi:beta-glucosidase
MKRIFLLCAVVMFSQVSAQTNDQRMNRFITDLMNKMTATEKLGQLNLQASGDITTGQVVSSDIEKKIREGKMGGLFNIKGVSKIRSIQKIAVENSRLKIPLLFGMDVIHGYQTAFPIPLALASSWDMNLVETSARIAAQEASADGICWTFSPMVDIARDPRWGRIAEGAGEDPYLGSQVAMAMVKGYQGKSLRQNNTIMSCVKHFALYGAAEAGRDYNTVDMSAVRMYNEYLPPYKAAIDAGAGSVMTSFNDINGIPATGNKWLLTDLLRKQWGFKGIVVTDYTAVNEMMAHGMGDLKTVSALAANAGVDMDMVGQGFLNTLPQSIKEGKVSQRTIDAACRRILEAKYKLGLFDDPFLYCDTVRAKTEILTTANRAAARKIAAETIVLLKNDGNLLPLKNSSRIAVVGPLANTKENMLGTWAVAADYTSPVSFLEGLKNLAGSRTNIFYAKGANVSEDSLFEQRVSIFGKPYERDPRPAAEMIKEALAVAAGADVIIAAVGELAEMTGESSSRTNIELPQSQKDLLTALLTTGKPVVIVLFTGRPLAITWENANFPAIVNAWHGGSEAGNAVADVLFGNVNPSGKLTSTWPQNTGQIPLYYNHKTTGRPLPEGKWFQKFTSNYLDVSNDPLYPFGYGLSYTSFSYSDIKLNKKQIRPGERLIASVVLHNTGNYDGKEVVELYLNDPVSTLTQPVKRLIGFKKVFLKKGGSTEVNFVITVDDLKFYNASLNHVAEPGLFHLYIGSNSRDVKETDFTLRN